MMKYTVSIGFILALLVTSCEKRTDDWTNLSNDFKIVYNTGSGWNGWQFNTMVTYPDSLFIYERHYLPVPKERTSRYLINKIDMDSLFLCLQKIKKINLTSYGFGPNKPTDYPITFFKYKNYGSTDSASIYLPDENEVPKELLTLLSSINRVIIKYDTLLNKN